MTSCNIVVHFFHIIRSRMDMSKAKKSIHPCYLRMRHFLRSFLNVKQHSKDGLQSTYMYTYTSKISKIWTVFDLKTPPGFNTTDGNSGSLIELG